MHANQTAAASGPPPDLVTAPRVRRIEAAATSATVVVAAVFVLSLGVNTVLPIAHYAAVAGFSNEAGEILATAMVFVVPLLWLVIDGAAARATYGMRKRGIFIRMRGGTVMSFGRCLFRIALGVVLTPVLPVSMILAGFDRQGRSLADRICRTAVYREQDAVAERETGT